MATRDGDTTDNGLRGNGGQRRDGGAAEASGARGASERREPAAAVGGEADRGGGVRGFFQRALDRLLQRGQTRRERERAGTGTGGRVGAARPQAPPRPERRQMRGTTTNAPVFDHEHDHGYVPRIRPPAAAPIWHGTERAEAAGYDENTWDRPPIEHGGSSVKQGLRGSSSRSQARGRDEFYGRGQMGRFDLDRGERTGRHYGRSGSETPGPGYGLGPLQRRDEFREGRGSGRDERTTEEPYGDLGGFSVPSRPQGWHESSRNDEAYGAYRPSGTWEGEARPGGEWAEEGGRRDRTAQRARRWRADRLAGEVMTRGPKAVRPSDTLELVSRIMVDEDCGIVPVVDAHNALIGVVTDRDIVCRVVARGLEPRHVQVRDAMTDEVECVTEHTPLDEVLRIMGEHQVRRVPVVARDDRLVGIIAMADIAREADVDESLQDTFEEISSDRRFWSHLR